MSLSDFKIKEITNKHTELADNPGKSAAQMKAFFDAPMEQLREAHNNFVDGVDAELQRMQFTEEGKGLSSNDYTDEDKAKLASIEEGAEVNPTGISAFNNDVGYITEHQDISGKVDKADGKSLSSNDFTDELKLKLEGEGSEVFEYTVSHEPYSVQPPEEVDKEIFSLDTAYMLTTLNEKSEVLNNGKMRIKLIDKGNADEIKNESEEFIEFTIPSSWGLNTATTTNRYIIFKEVDGVYVFCKMEYSIELSDVIKKGYEYNFMFYGDMVGSGLSSIGFKYTPSGHKCNSSSYTGTEKTDYTNAQNYVQPFSGYTHYFGKLIFSSNIIFKPESMNISIDALGVMATNEALTTSKTETIKKGASVITPSGTDVFGEDYSFVFNTCLSGYTRMPDEGSKIIVVRRALK